jgi:hypothetical protein
MDGRMDWMDGDMEWMDEWMDGLIVDEKESGDGRING